MADVAVVLLDGEGQVLAGEQLRFGNNPVARFSASDVRDEIRQSGSTQFNTLSAMISILWKLPRTPQERDHAVRQCMSVPVPRDAAQFRDRYRLDLASWYAATETFAVTILLAHDLPAKAGSAGKSRGLDGPPYTNCEPIR